MSKKYHGNKNQQVKKELEELDSSLGKIAYERQYDVPAGFFNDQKASILDKVSSGKEVGVKVPTAKGAIRRLLWPVAGVAAALTLLVLAQNYKGTEVELANTDELWDELDVELIEDYVLDDMEFSNHMWYQELDAAIESEEQ